MNIVNLKRKFRGIKIIPSLIGSIIFKTPIWVHFYLTRKCNLNCKYCFVKDNSKKDISTEEIKKIIDKLYSLGIRGISFFGGEPTIRKDFTEIVSYSVNKGIISGCVTNGTLLNSKYIEKIGKSGIDLIELSVDSIFEFDESKKDYTKSKKVLGLLLKFQKKYGFLLTTHLVLTNKNVDYVVKTIKLINKFNITFTIGLITHNTYNNLPECKSLFFNSEKSKNKAIKVIDEIIELKKKGLRICESYAYFEMMKKYLKGDKNWDCSAGKGFFAVDSDGSVQLCYATKPFKINILNIDKNFFKNRKKAIDKTLKKCTKLCLANCAFNTSYFIQHPIKSLFELNYGY